MPADKVTEFAFAKINRDLTWVMEAFSGMLAEQGGADLAAAVPWLPGAPPTARQLSTDREMQMLSMAFQLLNMVEENSVAQARRLRETEQGPLAEAGGWGHGLRQLLAEGCSAQDIAAAFPALRAEPVLTAHPTEAKRTTVLEQHRHLYLLLVRRENSMWTPAEQQAIRDEFVAGLELLWRTGEIRLTKPDVASERRNAIHYLGDVFPEVMPRVDARLRTAWRELGLDPQLLDGPGRMPRLAFGTWVGGDRDGHPLVTAEVTRHTLDHLRRGALVLHRRQLRRLGERLSLSELLQAPPPALAQAIVRLTDLLGESGRKAVARNPKEPWRQYTNLLIARLGDDDGAGPRYEGPHELLADLAVLRSSLLEIGARRLVDQEVAPVERSVEIFGFHLAVLDIRQNSAVHEKAITQLLVSAGIDAANWAEWSEKEKLALLAGELKSPRPLAHPEALLGPEAKLVLDCLRVVAAHRTRHGLDGLGALIVSMTRSLSDLLSVYVLAREAGLVRNVVSKRHGEGLACELPVVPLFETIEDLRGAPAILREFLDHPVTRRSLELQNGAAPVQQVMLGYSDSCKDGGIFASNWNLHRAQHELERTARAGGAAVRFFHGRGGTVSRGAGPTRHFLDALPHGSLHGDMRLTEQGETIAQRYGNPLTATYHLEQLLANTCVTALRHRRPQLRDDAPLHPLAEAVAQRSRAAYEALLAADGFLTYFSEATPIDVLENAAIGSRPSRRTGRRTLADLRAIPWVFSWNQSRHYLPGWYGLGTGLAALEQDDPAGFRRLAVGASEWPFLRYAISNIEQNLASVSLDLMADYAALVGDAGVRAAFSNRIAEEWRLTTAMVDRLFGSPMAKRRPRLVHTLAMRDTGLRRLHACQIATVRDWRRMRIAGDSGAEALLPRLLLTVNAIASGLRTTG